MTLQLDTALLDLGTAQIFVDQTTFNYFSDRLPVVRSGGTRTQTAREYSESKGQSLGPEREDALDVLGDSRAVLAMRILQNDEATREHQARFQELTERLRKLDPRVTDADIEALSDMVKGLEEMSSEMESLRKRHDL